MSIVVHPGNEETLTYVDIFRRYFPSLQLWRWAHIDETTLNLIPKGLKSTASINVMDGSCLEIAFILHTFRRMGVFHKVSTTICLLWTAVTFILLLDNDL